MASLPDHLPAGTVDLSRWRLEDADALVEAVKASHPELRRWLPWALTVPTPETMRSVLAAGHASFEEDREWQYVLGEPGGEAVVGSIGLGRLPEAGTVEMGYWVRSDRTGRGYATAAARALTDAAFARLTDVERVEIRMDRANLASAAVPRKLGYRLDRQEPRDLLAPGHTGWGFIWVADRHGWRGLRASPDGS